MKIYELKKEFLGAPFIKVETNREKVFFSVIIATQQVPLYVCFLELSLSLGALGIPKLSLRYPSGIP